MAPAILIVGATGNTGRGIVEKLPKLLGPGSALSGHRIIPLTRSLENPTAQHFAKLPAVLVLEKNWVDIPNGLRGRRDDFDLRRQGCAIDIGGTYERLNDASNVRAGQKAFATKTGHMGFSVPVIQVGDVIALIYGTTGPFILRPANDGTYNMVGSAYTHGFMDPDVL